MSHPTAESLDWGDLLEINHSIPKPTIVLGDQHGSLDALRGNLRALEFLDPEDNVIGNGRDLILLGDLFADRRKDDFEVAQLVLKIKSQMEAQGDQMHILMGNHDFEAVNFLVGGLWKPFKSFHYSPGISGIKTLGSLLEPVNEGRTVEECYLARANDDGFLVRFMSSEGGKAVATVLSMMQTRHRVGNVLFQHTPPTAKTLALIGDATLENNFSERIRSLLAGNSPFADSEEQSHWVSQLSDWVYAGNRFNQIPQSDEAIWTDLRKVRGISVLCFGHDFGSAGHESISTSEGKIELIGVDYRFGLKKRNEYDPECFSVSYFMPNGKVIVEIPAL